MVRTAVNCWVSTVRERVQRGDVVGYGWRSCAFMAVVR